METREFFEAYARATASADPVLRRDAGGLRIVFQLDHQDLAKRAQALGLLPGEQPVGGGT